MPSKVAVITTGGTIASRQDENSGLLVSGKIKGQDLIDLCDLSELENENASLEIDVHDFLQKPSMHLTFQDWLALQEHIKHIFTDPHICGIVITHGTDSMEETAYFLDLVIEDERPLVLTGSQRSAHDSVSDVFMNIRHALLVAAAPQMRGHGVTVVFNEHIFSARHLQKIHASNLQAFQSFGIGPVGFVDHDEVFVHQQSSHRDCYVLTMPLPRVDIITSYIEADGTYVRAAIAHKVNGLIVEGAGRGQVAPQMVVALQEAIEQGIVCVLTTSAIEGFVHPVYDYQGSANDLHERGIVLGRDYSSKKARIKLAVLLSAGIQDIQHAFNK